MHTWFIDIDFNDIDYNGNDIMISITLIIIVIHNILEIIFFIELLLS